MSSIDLALVEIVETVEGLDALPVGTIIADKEHDDWVKVGSEWTHKAGPRIRAKTLIALWGPVTVVEVPVP